MENEQLPTEDRLDVVPTKVQVDEEGQNTHDKASQELPAAVSQKPANTSPGYVTQDTPREVILQDFEECAPSTPQQVTQLAGSNSPVSSPTDVISSSELPYLRWLYKIDN